MNFPSEVSTPFQRVRTYLLSAVGTLSALGIARYQYPLDHALPVGAAECGAAVLFFAGSRVEAEGYWDPLRCRLAAVGSLGWGLFLLASGAGLPVNAIDAGFAVAAVLLALLGRYRAEGVLGAAGIVFAVGMRRLGREDIMLVFDLLALSAAFYGLGHWLQDELRARRDARDINRALAEKKKTA